MFCLINLKSTLLYLILLILVLTSLPLLSVAVSHSARVKKIKLWLGRKIIWSTTFRFAY